MPPVTQLSHTRAMPTTAPVHLALLLTLCTTLTSYIHSKATVACLECFVPIFALDVRPAIPPVSGAATLHIYPMRPPFYSFCHHQFPFARPFVNTAALPINSAACTALRCHRLTYSFCRHYARLLSTYSGAAALPIIAAISL